MRILIVGAGISGLTLAALLKQRGVEATIIERASNFTHGGYMLGLYPLGGNVLHGLKLHDDYVAGSTPINTYEMRNNLGKLVKPYDMSPIGKQYGPYQAITRPELMDLLLKRFNAEHIKMNTTISKLEQTDHNAQVEFSDGSQREFDIVIGADGIHSQTRKQIGLEEHTKYFRTGWGGWVWWVENSDIPSDLVTEYWGEGRFFGIYPTKTKVGVIACMPLANAHLDNNQGRQAHIRKLFADMGDQLPAILDVLPNDDQDMFFWELTDARCAAWSKGRVVLMGDSAAAFLPTAGVGASMAMESAAAMNDELSRIGPEHVPNMINLFIKRRRKRVEQAQTTSRKLSKYMFMTSALQCRFRDWMMNYYSAESLIKGITENFDKPL